MKTSLSVIVVDDEYWAREKLSALLADYPQIKIVETAATIQEARDVIDRHQPDAVFLDIQLREGTGFDVLAGLRNRPQVVFVTAFDDFALRAFEVNALDYLLKPIDRSRLAEAVNRLLSRQSLILSRAAA
jgi:two-component system LytT family response regulator